MPLTQRALKLVLDFEVSGEAGYNAKYTHPIWPGEGSGITIAIGCDLGFTTAPKFHADFAALDSATRSKLAAVIGLTGQNAKAKLSSVKDLTVPWSVAIDVFQNRSVPEVQRRMELAMPGVERLHPEIQGALWSLIYNRGASMEDTDRRREMRQIRDAVRGGKPQLIPGLIRSMVRLWIGTSIEGGMRRRREAEAALVEIGLSAAGGGESIPQTLPPLTRSLKQGVRGDDVSALQTALKALSLNPGPVDGDFGPKTLAAVKQFQFQAGLSVDGIVGPKTWAALGGSLDTPLKTAATGIDAKREALAEIAEREAAKGLQWISANSEAEKYLKPLRAPMRALGHIGSASVFYNWCAAFVTYCAREAGFAIPDQPSGLPATVALAETWRKWGQNNGTFSRAAATAPRRGDIVVFEWKDGDSQIDHIGIVTGYKPGSNVIKTAEGNRGNRSANGTRPLSTVVGYIRLK